MNRLSTQSLGRWGEDQAARYLEARGYSVLSKNVRTPYGEIDIIAQQAITPNNPQELVFVEVKTRASSSLGPPEISVNRRKQARLCASAQAFLQEHPEYDCPWRIDVIAIQRLSLELPPDIVHFQDAIH